MPGGAEKSVSIHVARPAGLHERIILRANGVLRSLESERGTAHSVSALSEEFPKIHSALAEDRAEYRVGVDGWRLLLGELTQVDIANLTPVQALNWLNDMQIRVREMVVR